MLFSKSQLLQNLLTALEETDALTSSVIGSSSLARLAATVFVGLFFIVLVAADFAGAFILAGTAFEALLLFDAVLTWL